MTTKTPALQPLVPPLHLRLPWGVIVAGFLGFLILLGVIAGVGRLFLGLGSTTTLTDAVPWGIWIGFDFLLIALSGAGFTMAALAHVFHLKQFQPAVRPAILAGMMGYVAVLLLLVLDLGRPDRFYHFLIYWNVHSPLFEISWCVLLYSSILAIEVSPYVFERLGWEKPVGWFFRLITPVTIIGVTLSSLHQSTLGTLYLNMPHRLDALWYTPVLPLLFFTSSILAGLSVAVLAYKLAAPIRRKPVRPEVVQGLGKGIAWMALIYTALKLVDIVVRGELSHLLAFDRLSLLMWLEIGLGAIVPAVLLLIPSTRARSSIQWLAPLLIIFGLGLNRFNATLFAQTSPLPNAAYTPHILEWLSTLGVLAAAALAWYLGIRLFVIFDSKLERKFHH